MGINILFNIGVQIFEISLFYMFINTFLDIEERRKKYSFLLGTAAVIIFTFSNSYDAFNSLIIKAHLYNVLVYILILFIFSIPYSGKFITKIFVTFVFTLFSYVVEILVTYLSCILLHKQTFQMTYGTIALAISASSIIKLAVFNILTSTKRKENTIPSVPPVNTIMLMIPVVSVAVIFCISKTFLQIKISDPTIVVVALLGIVYINLVMFYLFDYMNRLNMENINATLLKQEIDSNQELYKKILEGQSELRNIRHDLKNRLSGIYAILQNNNSEGVLAEISDIINNVDNVSEIQYSNNILINSILNYKLQTNKVKNINIKTDINLPNEINIESGDLGVIIGNLLDNAIESCQYVDNGKAFINIRCCTRINVFIFIIENSRNPENVIKLKDHDRINHGRGVKNVKKLIEKYHGNIEMNKEFEDIYKVEVTMLL